MDTEGRENRSEYSVVDGQKLIRLSLAVLVAIAGALTLQVGSTPGDVPLEIEAFYEKRIQECQERKTSFAGFLVDEPSGTLTSGMNCAGAPRGC